MKLYSIKNTQTDRFNPPFVARDNDDAIETCRKAIIIGRDISLLVELDNLVLFSVGEFDAITGSFTVGFWSECKPEVIEKLSNIQLPNHIQDLIKNLTELLPFNLTADLKEVKE